MECRWLVGGVRWVMVDEKDEVDFVEGKRRERCYFLYGS